MTPRIDRERNRRGTYAIMVIIIVAIAANAVLGARYFRYQEETNRLRAGMSKAQRERTDAVVSAERHRRRVELELVRRQARGDKQLHLAVNVDSNRMVLERDGIVLRDMPVRLGPERFRGAHGDSVISVQILGQRTIERVLRPSDSWDVPRSVFSDRLTCSSTVRRKLMGRPASSLRTIARICWNACSGLPRIFT